MIFAKVSHNVFKVSLMKNFLRIILAITVIFGSAPLAFAAQSYELVYRVQWGDAALGTAKASWQMDETSYQMTSSAATEGALSFLYEFEGSNTLSGEITNGTYRPSHFTSQSVYDDEEYLIDMSWPKGIPTPIFTVTPEPKQKEIHVLRKAALRNVVDPYTAMLQALTHLKNTQNCDSSYRVFDGRRRSELLLKDLGSSSLTSDTEWGYSGPVHICGSASKLIGGHRLDSNYDPDEPLDFDKFKIYIAEMPNGQLMPVRLELNSFFGAVTVRLDMAASNFNS